eukprot:m.55161 g.55161  ORF g.55161 m.55161 type:complete len:97 (+) comp9239_c0_seq1:1356-1646(+)
MSCTAPGWGQAAVCMGIVGANLWSVQPKCECNLFIARPAVGTLSALADYLEEGQHWFNLVSRHRAIIDQLFSEEGVTPFSSSWSEGPPVVSVGGSA